MESPESVSLFMPSGFGQQCFPFFRYQGRKDSGRCEVGQGVVSLPAPSQGRAFVIRKGNIVSFHIQHLEPLKAHKNASNAFSQTFFQEQESLDKASCHQPPPPTHLLYELFRKPKRTIFRRRTEQPKGQVDFKGSLTLHHSCLYPTFKR